MCYYYLEGEEQLNQHQPWLLGSSFAHVVRGGETDYQDLLLLAFVLVRLEADIQGRGENA